MQLVVSPVPFICISPASPEESLPLPSPSTHGEPEVDDDDGFRSKHLSPPPHVSPRYLSPLGASVHPAPKGLDKEQFDRLLKASRERRAVMGVRKAPDLRKELAIKNQKTKQLERRARFLSKVSEPPSPTATITPKTPPDSPAVLHCTLPSPGLESPLSMFEAVAKAGCSLSDAECPQGWVEQIDFCLPVGEQSSSASRRGDNAPTSAKASSRRLGPSLDEITARMGGDTLGQSAKEMPINRTKRDDHNPPRLQGCTRESRRKINVGRLLMPLRTLSPGISIGDTPEQCPQSLPPIPLTPTLEVKTTIVPRTTRVSPFPLNESNLRAFSRLHVAKDMIKTLKRRSSFSIPGGGRDPGAPVSTNVQLKRRSAPAELYCSGRAGFQHDVLSIHGGF
ncbi:hypothetical protein ID866_1520 [Astraeus odoratus]|nr:hypothetical protein ID866_1520 [Astraeus odoratus]